MSLKSRRRQLPSEWWQIIYPKSVLHHLSSMGMFVQCQNSWWHVSTSLKSLQHTPLSSKYWHHFSLHLQSLDKDSLHLQLLVGIFEILMSGYSAMHPWCLSYVASENWCCCSFTIKVHISATSMQVQLQVLMWSIDMASWQRWMLAWLLCKWSFDVASWMLARLRCKWSFDVASWILAQLWCEWSVDVASWQRWMLARFQCKNWCNFNASASANVECCRGFMTKMNIGTALVQMKFWCGFINIGTDLMRMKCWRSFMAKMDVGTTLVWMKCWRGFMIKMNFGTALVWMKCCHGFMTEMNFGMTSVWMKCCHGFMTKTNVGTTSVQMMVWLQYECKC